MFSNEIGFNGSIFMFSENRLTCDLSYMIGEFFENINVTFF